jgi:hypothetical protein
MVMDIWVAERKRFLGITAWHLGKLNQFVISVTFSCMLKDMTLMHHMLTAISVGTDHPFSYLDAGGKWEPSN